MFTDSELSGISLPLWWENQAVFLDSVSYIGSCASHIAFRTDSINNSAGYMFIGIVNIGGDPIPPCDSLLCSLWFTAETWASEQSIQIDSGQIGPTVAFKFSAPGGGWAPAYTQGLIEIVECESPEITSWFCSEEVVA
jgi:hypothetical protein